MAFNKWRTSDIRVTRDSAGYYDAEHKYVGQLYETCIFASRTEARRAAVLILREKQRAAALDDGHR